MVKNFKDFIGEADQTDQGTDAAESDQIPAIFATIHHRSDSRPDGYLPEDISYMNVLANAHMPELQKELMAAHRLAFPDHKPDDQ